MPDNLFNKRDFLQTSLMAGIAAGLPSSLRAQTPDKALAADQELWVKLLDRLKMMGAQALDNAEYEGQRIKALEHNVQMMVLAWFRVMATDADNPYFVPIQNFMLTTASPNPDTQYYATNIRADAVYRISGNRGNVDFADIQISKGVAGIDWPGPRLSGFSLDDVSLDADGNFEVILGGPKPSSGDWFELPAGAANLTMRSLAKNWVGAVDTILAIERIDRPLGPSWPRVEPIAEQLDRIAGLALRWTELFAERPIDDVPYNDIVEYSFDDMSAVKGQFYYRGRFVLTPDECLIMETDVPTKVRYWNVQLSDDVTMTFDYALHQCSLNDAQAHLDPDGKFRAVISMNDPGVPNWLDTGGYPRGMILGRWLDGSENYLPSLRRVKLSELRDALPNGTPVINTKERDIQRRQRRTAAQLRRKW